jgi:hypothetical protein
MNIGFNPNPVNQVMINQFHQPGDIVSVQVNHGNNKIFGFYFACSREGVDSYKSTRPACYWRIKSLKAKVL